MLFAHKMHLTVIMHGSHCKSSICRILHFFRGKVRNAVAFYKKYGNWENISHEKPRQPLCRTLVDPFLTSTEIRGQMAADYGINVSV